MIVAHDGAAWLPRVMDALAKQTRSVQRVVAVDTGSSDRSGSMLAQAFGRAAVFGMERNTGYGVAIAKALRHRSANAHVPLTGTSREDRTEWVWLLHDDSEPAPDALEHLLAAARESPTAAVFGPKIMDWSDRDVLLEAGTTIDRAGRRITGIEPREVDQGQHDGDRDVLAVSSAGMLARRDVWEHVGGFDPGMRLFREDTDFCWRVQEAGHKVRVVTEAVVYHVEATARNRRDASAAQRRRREDRRNALLVLTGNLPARPMLSALAGNLVLSTLRTVFFLLAKRPAAALDELAAYTSVAAHPLRLLRARRIRARGRQQAFSRLNAQLPAGHSFRMLAEYATSTLSKTLPAEAVGSHHATDDPSDDDSLLVDTGLVQRLLTSPGVLLFLTLTVVALVAERSLLGSTPLGGGALVPAWGGVSGLWQQYLQGFHPVSIGTSASAPPYVALLAALATVLGGKPWLAVDVILLGCVPLAGATAFFATRRVTRFVPVRVLGALAYALLPVGLGAVAAGRLGTAVLLVLLPPAAVLAGRVLTAPRRRARRAAWAAALLSTVVAAFVPLFWLIAAVVLTAGLVALHRRARLLDALIVAGVPPLLLLPWTLDIAAHPARIFLEAGLARPGLASAGLTARSLLLLSPGGPGLPPFWVTGGLVLAATVAVVASRRRRLVLAGWLVGVTGLITAAAVSRIAISQAGTTAPVRAWPGPALAIAGAGLLLAVVAAGDQVPGLLRAGRWRYPAGLAVIGLGAVACTAPALTAAHWVSAGVTGPVRPAAGALLPEFVAVSSDTGQRLRTLVLQTGPHGSVTYLVLRDSDPVVGSEELALPAPAQQALSRCVATLTAPSGSAITDQGRDLAGFGIGYVLLPAPVNGGLAHLLDDVPGLRPVSVTSAFELWRVVDTTARVTVTEPGGKVAAVPSGPVNVTAAHAPAAGGTLVIAEPAGGWSATLNGNPLTPLAAPVNGWAQGFRLPSGGGALSVSHSDAGRVALVAVEGLAVLVVAGLALPGSRSAEQEEPAGGEGGEAGPETGRRRAGHGKEPEERSRRRRLPRRGAGEPEEDPGTEVFRPAIPARAFARRAAAVPAGVRAGWPRRGGASDAEPFPGDAERPDGDSYPGDPGYPGSPSRPAPAGRRAAADLTSETVAYRAPAGDSGRHSNRGAADLAGRGPGTDPGRPAQDFGPRGDPGAAGRDYPGAPGSGAGLPPGRGQDAPRGRGFGPRRGRRDAGSPGGPGADLGGRRPFGGRSAPQAGQGDGPDPDPAADSEARERFSLPKRRGAGGERAGRFGRGRAAPPTARGSRGDSQPDGGYPAGGRDGGSQSSDSYPAGSYQGARGGDPGGGRSSGPYPSGSYQGGGQGASGGGRSSEYPGGSERGGRPAGRGPGSGDPSGPYPSGSGQDGRSAGRGPGSGDPSGPYPGGSYQGGQRTAGRGPGSGDPSGPYPGGSDRGARSAGRGPGSGDPSGPYSSGPYQGEAGASGGRRSGGSYPSGSHQGGGHPSGPLPGDPYQGGPPRGGGYDPSGHPSGPLPGDVYRDARAAGGRSGDSYPASSYRGGPGAPADGGGHPSGPLPGGGYQDPPGGGASGPHPSGSYQGEGTPGGHPSGPLPGDPYRGGTPQGGSYPEGQGSGEPSARGRGRRGRSPGHARASRPGAAGPAQQRPGGWAAEDDGALSPLPPLPPRAAHPGEWDDPAQDRDDQGDADW